jgi:hypothetical protein
MQGSRTTLSTVGLLLLLQIPTLFAATPVSQDIALAYIGPPDSHALLGLQQGLAEANIQGRFLGQRYTLTTLSTEIQAVPKVTLAIYTAGDNDTLRSLSKRYPKTPIFNLALDDDALRAACLPNVMHVLPSARMKVDAINQWHKLHPDSQAQALAWHADFEKYSGVQLNSRFRKTQGQAMDDLAWAGWAAIKMTADSVARDQARRQGQILRYLRKDLAFDGQKGIDMNFRYDGQLRQVILLVENGKILGEAPVRGVVDPQDLDSLGVPDNCNRTPAKPH